MMLNTEASCYLGQSPSNSPKNNVLRLSLQVFKYGIESEVFVNPYDQVCSLVDHIETIYRSQESGKGEDKGCNPQNPFRSKQLLYQYNGEMLMPAMSFAFYEVKDGEKIIVTPLENKLKNRLGISDSLNKLKSGEVKSIRLTKDSFDANLFAKMNLNVGESIIMNDNSNRTTAQKQNLYAYFVKMMLRKKDNLLNIQEHNFSTKFIPQNEHSMKPNNSLNENPSTPTSIKGVDLDGPSQMELPIFWDNEKESARDTFSKSMISFVVSPQLP